MSDVFIQTLTPPEIKIGDKVKLLSSIYDDGEDHHPPGWLATIDEIVIVRKVLKNRLAVSHENVTDSSFIIYDNEYEVCLD